MPMNTPAATRRKAMDHIASTGKVPAESVELVTVGRYKTWAGEYAIRGTFRDMQSGNTWFFAFLDNIP